MANTRRASIQIASYTLAEWQAWNGILRKGQLANITDAIGDAVRTKIGDGVTAFNSLPYYNPASSSQTLQQTLGFGNTTGPYDITVSAGQVIKNPTDDGKLEFGVGRAKITGSDGVTTHYFDANFTLGHAQIYSDTEIHMTSPKYLVETFGTHSFQIEDTVGVRISANSGDADLFFNELNNDVYLYSASKFTVDAPVFSLPNLTASRALTINANNELAVSTTTVLELSRLSGVTSSVQGQLNARELLTNKGVANGYAPLDASAKIATSYLPAIALTDVFVVASQAAQLALTAEEGDVAVRTDLNKSYIHNGGSSGTMADWQELLTPTDSVTSVNGGTGPVTITTTGTSNRITVTGGTGLTPTIDISSSYVGQNTITTLGTIGTGTWQGSSISTTYTDAKIKGSAPTTGGILYQNGTSDTVANSNTLFYDNTNLNFGIGTSAPDAFSFGSSLNHVTLKAQTGKTMSFLILSDGTNGAGFGMGNASIRRGSIVCVNGSNMEFYSNPTNSGTGLTKRMEITSLGNVVLGTQAALGTTATDGFAYMPTCAGTPTGVPTSYTGKVAWVYDTTNNKIYVYNGAWKASAALT